jgi:hypothetical protein
MAFVAAGNLSATHKRRPEMTYARLSTFQADPGKLEDGIRFFREQAIPDARKLQDFQGARLLVDRQSGKVQTVTIWESESAAAGLR